MPYPLAFVLFAVIATASNYAKDWAWWHGLATLITVAQPDPGSYATCSLARSFDLGIICRMIAISVLYPKTDSSHFDHLYYFQHHIPLVRSIWSSMGLVKVDLLRGTATLDGAPPPYELIGILTFTSVEHVQDALANGAAVLADIANFTNVQPLIQLNETVTA